MAAQGLIAAIQKAKSNDTNAIRDALSGLTFDSIAGQVTVRAQDHQLLMPSYFAQVVNDGGSLAFKILNTTSGKDASPQASPDCKMT